MIANASDVLYKDAVYSLTENTMAKHLLQFTDIMVQYENDSHHEKTISEIIESTFKTQYKQVSCHSAITNNNAFETRDFVDGIRMRTKPRVCNITVHSSDNDFTRTRSTSISNSIFLARGILSNQSNKGIAASLDDKRTSRGEDR
jgi:hypothetical protein